MDVPKRVLVLKGGTSPERDVSLHTGENVAEALRQAGFQVEELDAMPDAMHRIDPRSLDVAFIAMHGSPGEDGTVQGLLSFLGIPYTGSGVLASALAMHKGFTRHLFSENGIPTFPGLVLDQAAADAWPEAILAWMGKEGIDFPLIAKPVRGGSTIGTRVMEAQSAIRGCVAEARRYDPLVLVEPYRPGREMTVSVLGADNPQALPIIEIIAHREFYTYDAKYLPGGSTHQLPAAIDEELGRRLSELAVRAHRALGCYAMSRVDFILHEETRQVFALELNTIPGMTNTSLLPEAAAHAGITFPDLVRRLVEWAWQRAHSGCPAGIAAL